MTLHKFFISTFALKANYTERLNSWIKKNFKISNVTVVTFNNRIIVAFKTTNMASKRER